MMPMTSTEPKIFSAALPGLKKNDVPTLPLIIWLWEGKTRCSVGLLCLSRSSPVLASWHCLIPRDTSPSFLKGFNNSSLQTNELMDFIYVSGFKPMVLAICLCFCSQECLQHTWDSELWRNIQDFVELRTNVDDAISNFIPVCLHRQPHNAIWTFWNNICHYSQGGRWGCVEEVPTWNHWIWKLISHVYYHINISPAEPFQFSWGNQESHFRYRIQGCCRLDPTCYSLWCNSYAPCACVRSPLCPQR